VAQDGARGKATDPEGGKATGSGEGEWEKRFVAAPPRLQEAVALYKSLGLEVRLEPPGPDDLEEVCETCAAAVSLFRVIYTRSQK
jgi:hypothetical protein